MTGYLQRSKLAVKISVLLKVMSDLEEGFFIKVPPHELQAYGQILSGEATGDGQGGDSGQIC